MPREPFCKPFSRKRSSAIRFGQIVAHKKEKHKKFSLSLIFAVNSCIAYKKYPLGR